MPAKPAIPSTANETAQSPLSHGIFSPALGTAQDATDLLADLSAGRLDMSQVLQASQAAQQRHAAAFTQHFEPEIAAPAPTPPLEATRSEPNLRGLPFSVKDLFDVSGHPTWAGSRLLHPSGPRPALPAAHTAPAVQRLLDAGGTLTGKTHMVEFAFAGVGLNPHTDLYAQPHNAWAAGQNAAEPLITGGSSSGAALAVACGASAFALGTDTGGSVRIPAALCGLVGLKPTALTVPRQGALPLSKSLDSVGAITRSVRDAALVHSIVSGSLNCLAAAPKPLSALRLAVIEPLFLDGLSAPVAAAFEGCIKLLAEAGARIQRLSLDVRPSVAALTEGGGIVAYEAFDFHERQMGWLSTHGEAYDPRVRSRIARGAAISDGQYRHLLSLRSDFCASTRAALDHSAFDAVLSPTVPCTAPPVSAFAADTDYFALNALLLRNPSVVNLLDGCAISVPLPGRLSGQSLPVGLMLWQMGGKDWELLNAAQAVESIMDVGAVEAALRAG